MSTYTETQLDALRELANIGSGQAAAALSTMLGHPVDISVPTAAALPLAEAVAVAGNPDEARHGILVPIVGEFEAAVVLLVPEPDAVQLCSVYNLDPSGEDGASFLGEIGNILGTSYINVLAEMSGLDMEPAPPQVVHDMLGAILASVLLASGEDTDTALLLDSALTVEGKPCSLSFLLIPVGGGVHELLGRIGVV
ncbi:chemotaxis protein CheC [Paraconexibacter antarcticus]|uniref:Chemotaxis protein CheC n=1 Tax=Paraconexibacter antarcticus TaxID=2949664 RepID=A0ABY5DT72_9ACTN|nr:chemotaxis protein CheC [Paraconexibacter antarcticus]UTI64675.1 chemotaxis protein CheC [Paraconexibacter antarcticus]